MRLITGLLFTSVAVADCPPVDTCPWDVNTTHHISHTPEPPIITSHFTGHETFCAGATPRPRVGRQPQEFHTIEEYMDWHTPGVTLGEIMRKRDQKLRDRWRVRIIDETT